LGDLIHTLAVTSALRNFVSIFVVERIFIGIKMALHLLYLQVLPDSRREGMIDVISISTEIGITWSSFPLTRSHARAREKYALSVEGDIFV